ncbi:RNA-binding protein, putative [Entamoeba invadens IP1]|uniref:RNA-binding protein, putative n=1 Tax=Entamoeba invadens IP1 TaxID=370355 RepID=A0A0A1U4G8_ENTIV|nr:RNA-binding protein, putative [Entamoeba invadens IP1]ELP86595.1 RNA-binding protein, putative [Entamoeba invadens IP1]|eukprot:XP_004185941.1 RNA-binding protein, putative [Entamoeba invadens IP1]
MQEYVQCDQSVLYVSNLPTSISDLRLRETFSKFGQVDEATIIFDRETKKSKGCGFVKFVYRDDAVSCYNYHKFKKNYVVEWARSQIHRASQADKYTIFIGNLSKLQATQKQIERRFNQYGVIEKVTIINRTTETTAYAFVKYDNTLSPTDAITAENNSNWDGQIITVELSENSIPTKKESFNASSMSIKPLLREPSRDLLKDQKNARESSDPSFTFKYQDRGQEKDEQKEKKRSFKALHSSPDMSTPQYSSHLSAFKSSSSNTPYSFTPFQISPHQSPLSATRCQNVNTPNLQGTQKFTEFKLSQQAQPFFPSQKLHRQPLKKDNNGLSCYSKKNEKIEKPERFERLTKQMSDVERKDHMILEKASKADSMPEIPFPESLAQDAMLNDAMDAPMRKLRRDDDLDLESLHDFMKKSSFLADDD